MTPRMALQASLFGMGPLERPPCFSVIKLLGLFKALSHMAVSARKTGEYASRMWVLVTAFTAIDGNRPKLLNLSFGITLSVTTCTLGFLVGAGQRIAGFTLVVKLDTSVHLLPTKGIVAFLTFI